ENVCQRAPFADRRRKMRRSCVAGVANCGSCGREVRRCRIIVRRWRRIECGGDYWLAFNEREQRSFVDQPLRTVARTNFLGRDLALNAIVLHRAFGRNLAMMMSEKLSGLSDRQRVSEVIC